MTDLHGWAELPVEWVTDESKQPPPVDFWTYWRCIPRNVDRLPSVTSLDGPALLVSRYVCTRWMVWWQTWEVVIYWHVLVIREIVLQCGTGTKSLQWAALLRAL